MPQGRLDLDTGRAGQGKEEQGKEEEDSWGITFRFGAANEGSR